MTRSMIFVLACGGNFIGTTMAGGSYHLSVAMSLAAGLALFAHWVTQ